MFLVPKHIHHKLTLESIYVTHKMLFREHSFTYLNLNLDALGSVSTYFKYPKASEKEKKNQ